MSRQRYFIFTAPHSVCVEKERDCDTRAAEAAVILYETFSNNHVPCSIFLSNSYRGNRDENRAGDSIWWRLVKFEIDKRMLDYDVIYIDVHSFPMKGFGEGWESIIHQPKIIFMQLDKLLLMSENPKYVMFPANKVNRNISYAAEKGLPTVLIEFNEDPSVISSEEITEFSTKLLSVSKATSFPVSL